MWALTLWNLSIFFRQNFPYAHSSQFSPVKILRHTVLVHNECYKCRQQHHKIYFLECSDFSIWVCCQWWTIDGSHSWILRGFIASTLLDPIMNSTTTYVYSYVASYSWFWHKSKNKDKSYFVVWYMWHPLNIIDYHSAS